MKEFKIAILDDEKYVGKLLGNHISEAGYSVEVFSSGIDALKRLRDGEFDLGIIDFKLSDISGIQVIKGTKLLYPDFPFVVITAYNDKEFARNCLNSGVHAIIEKPFKLDKIMEVVHEIVQDLSNQKALLEQIESSSSNLSFSIDGNEKSIVDSVAILSDCLAKAGDFDEMTSSRFATVAFEAITNAATHGNKGAPDKKVDIDFSLDNMKLQLIVKDYGDGFNVEDVPDPTAKENLLKNGGRGIHIMKAFMDSIEYKDNGTKIVIKKNLSAIES